MQLTFWKRLVSRFEKREQYNGPWADSLRIPESLKGHFPPNMDPSAIQGLPLASFQGDVYLIDSDRDVPHMVKKLRKESLLGFDTESRPAFRRGESYPTALVQFGTADSVYLVQLLKLKKPEALRPILEDPNILKSGVALLEDIRKLQDCFDFEPAGFVDLGPLALRFGITSTGLRSLAALLLGLKVSKSAQVSNWALSMLSSNQVEYAAVDAWISRRLYERMCEIVNAHKVSRNEL
jgi:ribonuclease D